MSMGGSMAGPMSGSMSRGLILLDWRAGTYANASPRYIWDADGKILYGAFAGGVPAIAPIDGKNRLQIEGARTNLVDEIYDDFSVTGTPTLTSNQSDPAGGTTALKLEGIDTSNYINDATTGGTNDALCAVSTFLKHIDTTGTVAFRNHQTQTLGDWSVDAAVLGSGWGRIHSTRPEVTIISGRVFKNNSSGNGGLWWRGNGGGFEDFYVWHPQYEDNVAFPSSPMAISATRAADSMQFAAASIPTAFTKGKWSVELTTMFADTDTVASEQHKIFFFDNNNQLMIERTSGGGVYRVRLTVGGTSVVRSVTHSRDQTATITVDFIAGELTTAGFTTGDGTTGGAITGGYPTNATMYVGHTDVVTSPFFGRISEPVAA